MLTPEMSACEIKRISQKVCERDTRLDVALHGISVHRHADGYFCHRMSPSYPLGSETVARAGQRAAGQHDAA